MRARNAEFKSQVARRIDGSLTEDEFKPLRLKNGVYLQLHAYMLRIAIPYGVLSAAQLRQLALIGERYDHGYGHFTTRQNLQFNWPKLRDVPEILNLLADVGMHCIQTSGNCIRNVTADHFAGVAADEYDDPRPICELLRQWSSAHPEFSYLPRKFKIAVTGAAHDRAVIRAHDIGLRLVRDGQTQARGFEVSVGGGLGRTPMIGKVVRDFLPEPDLLSYVEAIMRVYNLEGRRDNKYKARVKILVHEIGLEEFKAIGRPRCQCGSGGAGTDCGLFRTACLRGFASHRSGIDCETKTQCGICGLGRAKYQRPQTGRLSRCDDFIKTGGRNSR